MFSGVVIRLMLYCVSILSSGSSDGVDLLLDERLCPFVCSSLRYNNCSTRPLPSFMVLET